MSTSNKTVCHRLPVTASKAERKEAHRQKMATKRTDRLEASDNLVPGRSQRLSNDAVVTYRPVPQGLVWRSKEQWARDRGLVLKAAA